MTVPGPGGIPCAVGAGPGDAIAALVQRWWSQPVDHPAVLVGLGPAEVQALNISARARLATGGYLDGPALIAGGRAYQSGDRVMALRRVGVASGTYGTVTSVAPGGGQMLVAWPDTTAVIDRHDARRLGHGYAAGPTRLPPAAAAVLLLGDPRTVRDLPASVAGIALVAPTGRRGPSLPLDLLAARLGPPDQAAIATAAARSAPALEGDRRRLSRRLLAAAPPAAGSPSQGRPPSDGLVTRWVSAHAGDLTAWRVAGHALDRRADALARAVELQPALHRNGPRQAQVADRAVWQATLRARGLELDGERSTSTSTPTPEHAPAVDVGRGLG